MQPRAPGMLDAATSSASLLNTQPDRPLLCISENLEHPPPIPEEGSQECGAEHQPDPLADECSGVHRGADSGGSELDIDEPDSNSSGSITGSDDGGLDVEIEEMESFGDGMYSSDDPSTDNEPKSQNLKMVNRVNQLKDKLKRYKKLTKSYTAQLNHQTYLANHYSMRLEEEEKKCQEHIQKTIALSTRLDETKKWVRKLKKAVLAEKEKALPIYNEALANRIEMRKTEERRQEEFKRQCDTFIEQQNALNHELQSKCEKVEAMEATVQALSNEYNQKLVQMVARDGDWQLLLHSLNPQNSSQGQPPWPVLMLEAARGESTQAPGGEVALLEAEPLGHLHMQLRLENEVLRSNMQGVMQVVEHCYEENSRLSNLCARLTRSLSECNEREQQQRVEMPPGWDGSSPDEERHKRRKVCRGHRGIGTGHCFQSYHSPF